jgi:hypothetical protein
MATIKDRLITAAAKAYAKTEGLEGLPGADTATLIRFLDQQRERMPEPQLNIDIPITLSLKDIFALIDALERGQWHEEQYQKTWEAQNTWIDAWQRAKAIFRSRRGNWPTRSSSALKSLGFFSPDKRKRTNYDYPSLKRRYSELTTGHFDQSTQHLLPKMGRKEAIERIRLEFNCPSYEAAEIAVKRALKYK